MIGALSCVWHVFRTSVSNGEFNFVIVDTAQNEYKAVAVGSPGDGGHTRVRHGTRHPVFTLTHRLPNSTNAQIARMRAEAFRTETTPDMIPGAA